MFGLLCILIFVGGTLLVGLGLFGISKKDGDAAKYRRFLYAGLLLVALAALVGVVGVLTFGDPEGLNTPPEIIETTPAG